MRRMAAQRPDAVIFDLDGTITRPVLDFDAIRTELGLPPGPILETRAGLGPDDQRRIDAVLARHEQDAATDSLLHDGARELLDALAAAGVPPAVLTRNSRRSVVAVCERHGLWFAAVRTREDGAIKPSPEPVQALCRELGVRAANCWMIGDYLFDIQSGAAAGTRTALMIGEGPEPDYAHLADLVVRSLTELREPFGL